MKSTREKILRTLLTFPGSNINDLAKAVGINGISIRHHLTALEAEDLVTSDQERHGVGRPRLIYNLTEKGIEEFPTSYLRLTKRLLTTLKEKMSGKEITSLFQDIARDISRAYNTELEGKSLEERLNLVKNVMNQEGFITEWKNEKNSYTLTSFSCPYFKIALEHSEICALDVTLISEFVSKHVSIETCIFNDDDRCTYRIHL